MSEGSTKFLVGTAIGALGGFVLGSAVAAPTTRSASRSAGKTLAAGLVVSTRFVGRNVIGALDEIGAALESGYTRVRGREKYLEHEIEELREKISHLERRMD